MPKPKYEPVKLTKAYIDRVKAPSAGYETHWDLTVKGYGLRVSREGRRVFIANGRIRGKQASVALGPYGELTENEAREKARRVLQQMREGIDPHAERKQEEAAKVTLATVATEYVSRPGKLKDSSKKAIHRHVVTTLSKWKDKPIASITEEMCRARYREMLTKGLRGKKGAPGSPPLTWCESASATLKAVCSARPCRTSRFFG